MADRLGELAALGYEAFSRSCGGVDPANGCRIGKFAQLPLRVQGGWRDGVKAVLAEVYRSQELAKEAGDSGAIERLPAPNMQTATAASRVEPVEPVVPMSKQVGEPAGHSAVRRPRKLGGQP